MSDMAKVLLNLVKQESDVSYRCIGPDFDEGVVACGFMRKRTRSRSQPDFKIGYYSGFFLLSGSGTYVTGEGMEIPIRAGDYVQRLPGEVHSTYVEPDGQWLEFFFSFGRSRYETLQNLGLLPDARVSRCPVREKMPECALHLERLKQASDGELGILLSAQEQLLLGLLKYGLRQPGDTPEKVNETTEKIRQAEDILTAAPETNLSMEEVAKQLSMGYETFRKQFRKQTGISPADYRLQHRMRQACHMLDAGISIKETAEMMGYADVYTFTRQFTKTVGTTPGQYKRTGSLK